MPETYESDYQIFLIRGYTAGIFGEAYLIAAASTMDSNNYIIESYIISKKIEHNGLHKTLERIERSGLDEENVIDLECALVKAKGMGESEIIELVSLRAEKLNKNEQEFDLPNLESKGSLFSPMIQDSCADELKRILLQTNSEKLKRYLSAALKDNVSS